MKRWFLILLLATPALQARTVSIIVHGTWGVDSPWYLPGGDFFEAYKAATEQDPDHYCCTFSWSGKNSHQARVTAAQQLYYLISAHEPSTRFIIIAHSHGANIAFLASQFVAQTGTHSIDTIFALGAPINTMLYAPDAECVEHIVNLFSFRDLVQPVLGMFERQLPATSQAINMRVVVDDRQPQHSGLHNPTIAQWLPDLHAQIKQSAELVSDTQTPFVIKFSKEHRPVWEVDVHRSLLIQEDITLMAPPQA